MQRLNQEQFDWLSWRNGSLDDLGCFTRTDSIKKNILRLQKHAVGFCKSDGLLCRPKSDKFAVMFHVGGNNFWTHLTKQEFELLQPTPRER